MRTCTPLKWHGGKHYLAPKIVDLMPQHTHYVEPYAGGLSVLLAKNPDGISEVVNDIDGALTTFWCVMKRPSMFYTFMRIVEATPFSEYEWEESDIDTDQDHSPEEIAAAFFIRCRQSLAGRMQSFAPMSKTRTRFGMNEQVSAWISSVDGLRNVHQRLRRVVIFNRDALDVIREQDGESTLFYLDPPYLHETRATTSDYRFEMSREDHAKLLDVLQSVKGKFILSGYPSGMYDRAAAENGWRCHKFDMPNNAAGGKNKRRMTECVWANF